MIYLFLNNDETILLNKVGESIYTKNFPQKYAQKSNVLCKSTYHDYSASIDFDKQIHLVYKTSQNSICYLDNTYTNPTPSILLEDPENTYKITNIKLVCHKRPYLFYSAVNPYENSFDLIFHNFTDRKNQAPQALLSLPTLTSKYVCSVFNDMICLICCQMNQNNFEINYYTYNIQSSQWEASENLVTSEYPITDFSFTYYNGIHLTYTIEKFGHSTLYYGRTLGDGFISLEITSLGQRLRSAVFIYNDIIWINYMTSTALFACFSNNDGHSFSKSQLCTLQNANVSEICILGIKNNQLHGDFFFGYVDQQPNIAVLSQIDVDHLLYYSPSNTELKEMLRASLHNEKSSEEVENLKKELIALNEQQKSITQQYNELANFTKEVQNEGKKWRKKYQRLYKDFNDQKGIKVSEAKEDNGSLEDI